MDPLAFLMQQQTQGPAAPAAPQAPKPPMDPALLRQLVEAGLVNERADVLAQQMRRAQGLMDTPSAQGMRVGGTYQAASPLEHLASAMSRIVGGKQAKGLDEKMGGLIDQKGAARTAYMQGGADPMLGAISGDPAMAAAGGTSLRLQDRAREDAAGKAAAEAKAAADAENARRWQTEIGLKERELGNKEAGAKWERGLKERELSVREREAAAAAQRRDAEAAAKAEGERGKAAASLREELMDQPAFRNTQTVSEAYQKIQAASPTGPGDISLIFGYMKLLDPGSTVREGEFATAENAGGAFGKMGSWYNRVLQGEKLPEKVRKQFRDEAETVYRAQAARYASYATQYRRLAEQQGINPDDVVLDLGFPTGEAPGQPRLAAPGAQPTVQPASAPAQPAQSPVRMKAKNGKFYLLGDGGWELDANQGDADAAQP